MQNHSNNKTLYGIHHIFKSSTPLYGAQIRECGDREILPCKAVAFIMGEITATWSMHVHCI